ncbi:hypothetical protein NQ318_008233 [Aromia moschata]|uniref:Transposase n=1 Tax=Aromia moschata TaxID=1265417 RepID=A0AAV8XQX7_9CUCU|nr:hypothetical protein NQ318_008233 [Aromia moschata]
MDCLSEKQKIEHLITKGCGDMQRSQVQVCVLFNEVLYSNKQVSNVVHLSGQTQGTVCQLIKKFRETGNVKHVKRTGRPKLATSEENALNVLLTIKETPQVSTREVADNLEISHVSNRSDKVGKVQLFQQVELCRWERRDEINPGRTIDMK